MRNTLSESNYFPCISTTLGNKKPLMRYKSFFNNFIVASVWISHEICMWTVYNRRLLLSNVSLISTPDYFGVMRILGSFVVMLDEHTIMFGREVLNRDAGIIMCSVQLLISCVSMLQHVLSILEYRKIFFCHVSAARHGYIGQFISYDVIIYDYGLFNFLLGTQVWLLALTSYIFSEVIFIELFCRKGF